MLFEVVPLHEYRVVLQVDDRDMAGLRVGQGGALVLSSLPHDDLPFSVTQLTPVSTAKDGRNYFRVEAKLTTPPSDRLRPAMGGWARSRWMNGRWSGSGLTTLSIGRA